MYAPKWHIQTFNVHQATNYRWVKVTRTALSCMSVYNLSYAGMFSANSWQGLLRNYLLCCQTPLGGKLVRPAGRLFVPVPWRRANISNTTAMNKPVPKPASFKLNSYPRKARNLSTDIFLNRRILSITELVIVQGH